MTPRITRRSLIALAGSVSVGCAAAGLLAACGGAATATIAATATAAAPPPSSRASPPAAASPVASPTTVPATPAPQGSPPAGGAGPSPATGHEEEVTFTSGQDTLYGTILLPQPAPAGTIPAALSIAGSGPTDRDGNDAQFPAMDTNRNFALTLAAAGVASLRYDKLASGKTGLGAHPGGAGIDFNLFLQEARDAYDLLAGRPEVDPQRLVILGHSEGGLFALVLAQQLQGTPHPPRALVLAAPLGVRYLDLLRRQLDQQYQAAAASGQLTAAQATAAMQELDRIIASVREQGKFPDTITTPSLKALFNPANQAFLVQADEYDPAAVAAQLPPTLPVLVLHGAKDQQVDRADIDHLMGGFQQAGNQRAVRVELPDVDHIFKEVSGQPDPARDYADPSLPFSREAATQVTAFARQNLVGG